jgi:hypothetical protein
MVALVVVVEDQVLHLEDLEHLDKAITLVQVRQTMVVAVEVVNLQLDLMVVPLLVVMVVQVYSGQMDSFMLAVVVVAVAN